MPRALIFDVDGTLAETEEAHRRAFNETFATHGLDWHWSREAYLGLLKTAGGKERMAAYQRRAGGNLDTDQIARLHRAKTKRYIDIVANGGLALRPGVAELLALGRRHGLLLAVATTTSRQNVDALVRACLGQDADAVFDAVSAGDEVPRKKPAPDVYLLALRRLGVAAHQAIAFEDSRNGLLAARSAGLEAVVTPSIYTAEEDFAEAAMVLETLASFDPGLLEFPTQGRGHRR